MSNRNVARTVRQRKLNPKQGLHIIRESEIEEQQDEEGQRQVHQVETGVEKAEEVEYHLQAVINASNAAALGVKTQQSYIPTPDAIPAKDVNYDELYPPVFKEPSSYIRFSSTVEDCTGPPYCMNDDDLEFLGKLNEGKDVDGRDRKDKLGQCSEIVFEEVMSVFEESSGKLQPYANVDNAPIPSLEEIERSQEDEVSDDVSKWMKPIYRHWVQKKTNRTLMPTIKVRVLDTTSEADDADPYVCFRRREVRQTRKTRGRDAQVVEKLKKLRLEVEQGRQMLRQIVEREHLKADSLSLDRRVFNDRKELKQVKAAKSIIGDKGDDEELLVNQKPTKQPTKVPREQRPSTIRIKSNGDSRSAAPDVDLPLLEEWQEESQRFVLNTIDARKEQHKKWNQHWIDETKYPLTPPAEEDNPMDKWAQFPPKGIHAYPSPPPSLSSHGSQDTGDVEMKDAVVKVEDADQNMAGAEPESPPFIFHIPGSFPLSDVESEDEESQRSAHPACRLRVGRGGRCHLEARKRRPYGQLSRGVVSDSESDDDDGPDYFPLSERITFDYRSALNNRPTRPELPHQQSSGSHQRWASGDQSALVGGQPGSSGSQQTPVAGS
ncbi:Enhancer of polycomb-like protein 1 [Recurvomyces mirabilis]|nr:Enhancer of polycomb-like protein 1 [Recurvomyces mirabilis]